MSAGPSMALIPGNGQLIRRSIAATTDVTALAKLLIDAYHVTVTLERDMAANAAHYAHQIQLAHFEHEQIMQAMALGFEQQDHAIGVIERIASQLIARDQFDTAQAILAQMMELLRHSPVKQAYLGRPPRD